MNVANITRLIFAMQVSFTFRCVVVFMGYRCIVNLSCDHLVCVQVIGLQGYLLRAQWNPPRRIWRVPLNSPRMIFKQLMACHVSFLGLGLLVNSGGRMNLPTLALQTVDLARRVVRRSCQGGARCRRRRNPDQIMLRCRWFQVPPSRVRADVATLERSVCSCLSDVP